MNKRTVWKRFLVINSLVAVLVVATLAWFINSNHANVEPVVISPTNAGYIRISEDGGNTWHNNLTLNMGEANVLGELSGNGLRLYQPNYGINGIDGYRLYTDTELYLEKTFLLESDTSQHVYLTAKSFVAPANPQGNMSAYGEYSRDYIAGAIRVGFYEIDQNDNPQLLYIWAPNSRLQFVGGSVDTDGVVEDQYTYQIGEDATQQTVVTTNGNSSGMNATKDFVWGTPNQTDIKPIASFETQNGIPVQKSVMVRVWLEGSDRECVRQLHNGKFRLYFDFNSTKEG